MDAKNVWVCGQCGKQYESNAEACVCCTIPWAIGKLRVFARTDISIQTVRSGGSAIEGDVCRAIHIILEENSRMSRELETWHWVYGPNAPDVNKPRGTA